MAISDKNPLGRDILECAQEIDDFLSLLGTQPIEVVDDVIGFAPMALVGLDGLDQVGRAPIMQKEDALSDTP